MPSIVYSEELKRLSRMPYEDVDREHRNAIGSASLVSMVASDVLKKRCQPQYLTVFGLLRDMLRMPRRRLFAPDGGHWACIRAKIRSQRSDKDFIRNVIALGAFLGFVIFSLYQILK